METLTLQISVPNVSTLAAMKEAKSRKDGGEVNMKNLKSFIASME